MSERFEAAVREVLDYLPDPGTDGAEREARAIVQRVLACGFVPRPVVDDPLCAVVHDELRAQGYSDALFSWAESGEHRRDAMRAALLAALSAKQTTGGAE